jgi:hypothetical protein
MKKYKILTDKFDNFKKEDIIIKFPKTEIYILEKEKHNKVEFSKAIHESIVENIPEWFSYLE